MPRIPFICLSAAALVLVSACGAGSPDESPVAVTSGIDGGSTSTAAGASSVDGGAGSSSTDSAPPPEETSGTESAGPRQNSRPTIEVAELPIGVNADASCLYVRLLKSASEVPAGLGLVISGVAFDPNVIEIADSGCSGQRAPCVGVTLTESTGDECVIPVRAAATTSVHVRIAAKVDCPQGQDAACLDFKQKLDADERDVGAASVTVPEPDTSSSGSSSADSSSLDSSSSDSSSSGG